MTPQIVNVGKDRQALMGLEWWTPRTLPKRLEDGSRPALTLKWADRVAIIGDASGLLLPAFAEVIAMQLDPTQEGVLVFVKVGDAYWLGGFRRGVIEIGPERVYGALPEALRALRERVENEAVTRVRCSPELRDAVSEAIRTDEADVELRDLEYHVGVEGAQPVTEAQEVRSHSLVIGVVAVLAAVSVGVVAAASTDLFGREPVVEVRPAPEPRYFAQDWPSFADACRQANAEEWPRVLGWELKSEGCAIPRMDAPISVTSGGVAWRELTLARGFDEIIAQRMATWVFEDWPYEIEIVGERLVTYLPFETDEYELSEPPATRARRDELLERVEDAFAGVRQGRGIEGRFVQGRAEVEVVAETTIGDALNRFLSLDAADLGELRIEGDRVFLTIIQRDVRTEYPQAEMDPDV